MEKRELCSTPTINRVDRQCRVSASLMPTGQVMDQRTFDSVKQRRRCHSWKNEVFSFIYFPASVELTQHFQVSGVRPRRRGAERSV